MAKMVRIDKESVLDWFNTRQGKVIKKGTAGDHLTARDILRPAPKTLIKRKIKKVKTFKQIIESKGFTHTRIIFNDKVIELLRIIDKDKALSMYDRAIGVVYRDKSGKNLSKFYAKP